MGIANVVLAKPLWHCTAKNAQGAAWYHYNLDKKRAHEGAEKSCISFNNKQPCHVDCLPPKVYWRCVSHDGQADKTKQGAWYWVSYSKAIALHRALEACQFNSRYGGCYVNQSSCAES